MRYRSPYLLLSIILIGGVALLAPHLAHASIIGDGFVLVMRGILVAVGYVTGLLLSFAAMLAGWAMDLNLSVMRQNIIIEIGWGVTRDIANLVFVFIMIMIAFAMIIGNSKYGDKKLLIKLITTAILVNFSLAISGVALDAANIVTGFFLSKINAGPTELATKLADAFGPQKYFLADTNDPLPPDPDSTPTSGEAFGSGFLLSISSLLFTIAFTLIATIVMFTFAALLIGRYIQLTILLATAPLQWAAGAVPGYDKYYKKWWDEFTKWTFFAPAMLFFVYLALKGVAALAAHPAPAGFFKENIMVQIMSTGMQGVVLSGLLIMGLKAAQSMGIAGAALGEKAIGGLATGAKGILSSNARWAGQRLAASGIGRAVAGGATGTAVGLRRIGFKGMAGAAERAARTVEATAAAPKVVRAGIMSSLVGGAMGGAKIPGAGLFKPRGERKDEELSKNELLDKREELVKRQQKLKDQGVSPEALKAIADQISSVEGSIDKRYPEAKSPKDWADREKALNAELAAISKRGGDISYHKKAITNAKKKGAEAMEDGTLDDQLVKMAAFKQLQDAEAQAQNAAINAEQDPAKKDELAKKLKNDLAYYERKINEIENKIDPKDEAGLNEKAQRIQERRTSTIQALGVDTRTNAIRADTKNFDAQLARVRRALDGIAETKATRPVQFELEKKLDELQSEVDKDIASGKFVPGSTAQAHVNEQQMTAVKEQLDTWRSLASKKPKTAQQWEAQLRSLEDAQKKVDQFITKETKDIVDNLVKEAREELEKKREEANKNKGATPPSSTSTYSGNWTTT